MFGSGDIGPNDHDLTAQHEGAPVGERIVVSGRLLDDNAKPIANALIEMWQANSAGRYRHDIDDHDAPLDPNFTGAGRVLTGADGEYRFVTIKPAAYPWRNHYNAWRPAHLHFSLFGLGLVQRLVTQMYFPNDPLFAFDPIYQGTPENARGRLVSYFSMDVTQEGFALGYVFDIVLRGPKQTRFEDQ